MKNKLIVAWMAIVLPFTTASAQDFAIAPIGFVSVTGISSDGNFAVRGTMTPTGSNPLSDGVYAITGQVRSVVPAALVPLEEMIVNGSFENTEGTFVRRSDGLMLLQAGSMAIPGWTVTTGEMAWGDNTNVYNVQSPFGNYFLDLTGYSGPNAGIAQTIPTIPGRRYRLSLSLGSQVNYTGQKTVSVCAGASATLFTLAPTNTSGGQWSRFTFVFTAADPSTDITIYGIAGGAYLGLDNVSVTPDYSVTPPIPQNLVMNGGFEIVCPVSFAPDGNGIMSMQPGSTFIPGWTTTIAEIAWGMNGNAFGPRSPYGSLFLDFTGYHDSPPYGGITQTLATTPSQNYRLSFSIGAHDDVSAHRGPMTVSVTAGSVSNSFTFTPSEAGNQWGTFTMDFAAHSASTPLTFTGTASAGGAYLGLDNVSVVAVATALRLESVDVGAGSFRFGFNTVAGRTYIIESRESLESGAWQTVPGTETTGTGEALTITVADLFQKSQQFYRVKVTP